MNPPDTLTQRERDVLRLLCEGLSDQEIAQQLVLTVGTVKWYNKQIYGKLHVRNRAEARQLARKSWLLEAPPPPHTPQRRLHNLPAPVTPFIGRTRELAEIRPLLAANRLLTITGPGGMGKTRLALQLADSLRDHFPDGVYFVPLAPIPASDTILWTIADHIQFQFNPSGQPEDQLLDYLREKSLLLLLDNFEHLMPNTGLVAAILAAAREVKVIATSRLRLNQYGEAVYTVSGMTIPEISAETLLLDNEAVQLFLASARRVLPTYKPDQPQLEWIARICLLVEGTPLGIELAAPWVEALTLDEIAQEIGKNLDFLNRQLPDVPPRQHSIRAAFDYSWGLLTGEERAAFSQLSVFRGGFTRDAAAAVCEVKLPTLMRLVNKSLLWHDAAGGRYQIHELLSQYAEEKLETTGEQSALQDAHMTFYAAFLSRLTPDLKGRGQLQALEAIDADFENIRAAWIRVVQTRNPDLLEPMLEPIYLFCLTRNRYQEGDEFFEGAAVAFAPQPDQQPDAIWGHILAHHLVHTPAILAQVEQSLHITRQHGVQRHIAFGLWTLSRTEIMAANLARALELCEECLAYYQALDDSFWRARLLLQKSVIYAYWSQASQCLDYLGQALQLSHEIGAINIEAHALGNLANITRRLDNLPEAERLCHQAAALDERLNDYGMIAWNRGQLGVIAFLKGDFTSLSEAATLCSRAAAYFREVQVRDLSQLLFGLNAVVNEDYPLAKAYAEPHIAHFNIHISLYASLALALAGCGLGDFETARRVNREFIMLQWEWGDTASVASVLALEAFPLTDEGQPERAVELLALAFTYPQTVAGWLQQWPPLTRLRARLQAELGAPAYDAAWDRGKRLPLESVVENVLNAVKHQQ